MRIEIEVFMSTVHVDNQLIFLQRRGCFDEILEYNERASNGIRSFSHKQRSLEKKPQQPGSRMSAVPQSHSSVLVFPRIIAAPWSLAVISRSNRSQQITYDALTLIFMRNE